MPPRSSGGPSAPCSTRPGGAAPRGRGDGARRSRPPTPCDRRGHLRISFVAGALLALLYLQGRFELLSEELQSAGHHLAVGGIDGKQVVEEREGRSALTPLPRSTARRGGRGRAWRRRRAGGSARPLGRASRSRSGRHSRGWGSGRGPCVPSRRWRVWGSSMTAPMSFLFAREVAEDDDRELEALGAVDRHQSDDVVGLLGDPARRPPRTRSRRCWSSQRVKARRPPPPAAAKPCACSPIASRFAAACGAVGEGERELDEAALARSRAATSSASERPASRSVSSLQDLEGRPRPAATALSVRGPVVPGRRGRCRRRRGGRRGRRRSSRRRASAGRRRC